MQVVNGDLCTSYYFARCISCWMLCTDGSINRLHCLASAPERYRMVLSRDYDLKPTQDAYFLLYKISAGVCRIFSSLIKCETCDIRGCIPNIQFGVSIQGFARWQNSPLQVKEWQQFVASRKSNKTLPPIVYVAKREGWIMKLLSRKMEKVSFLCKWFLKSNE